MPAIRIGAACTALVGVLSAPGNVLAYSCGSVLTNNCHERITMAALRRVRPPVINPGPKHPKDAPLLYELPFKIDDELKDIATAALLIGNRYNDFRGLLARETDELAYIGDDPGRQKEHFLRGPDQDEDKDGARSTIADARAFIERSVFWALDHGLDGQGTPDPDARTVLPTYLNYSGTVNVKLPLFYTYLGHAIHTLQDSFAHTLRTHTGDPSTDAMMIVSPMNSLESTQGDFDERRDGPHEPKAMDECEDLDERRWLLYNRAVDSTEELLRAVLTPAPDQRKDAVTAVLDKYLGYQPGCTYENNWCDAPENEYRNPKGCRCETASGGLEEGWPLLAGLVLLAGLRRARRRATSAGVIALLLLLLPSTPARAEGGPASSRSASTRASEQACVPGRQLKCDCAEGPPAVQVCEPDGRGFGKCGPCPVRSGSRSSSDDLFGKSTRFGMEATLGAALDKTAFAFSAAARLRLHEKYLVGFGLEWNPWASFEVMEVNRGVLNIYATAIRRFPIGRRYALRTTAHFGLSYLLLDLVAAQKGSVGVYMRINFLGLEYRMTRLLRLVMDPADVVLAIPQVTGTPLTYIQYRFSLGLMIGS